jgi:phage tail protein X
MMNSGTLEKVVIKAFTTPDFSGTAIDEFRAFVNPNEITLAYEMEYDAGQGAGTTGSRMEFKKVKPGDMSLAFFLDGTGASGTPLDVQAAIAKFQTVTGYNGEIHRPNYLKVMWGTLQVKRCVLKSASIAYKLFRPDGVPLRAVISATFTDSSDDQTRVAIQQDQSADLTHVRVVKAGDTLPAMCAKVYGNPGGYLAVARFNRLDNFRALPAGTRIVLPPAEQLRALEPVMTAALSVAGR